MTSGDRDAPGHGGAGPAEPNISGHRSPDGLPPLRSVIRDLSLTAKKSLGQNFILDLNLTRRIARAGGPIAGRTVVEVGPGPGGLTRGLLLEGAARVIAVERDDRCRPALEAIAARWPGRLEIHMGDALEADWPALLGHQTGDDASKATIAANLPYGVATKLLTGWLETEPWPPWFASMVLMFQREVAERIVATPNTKAYGRLAVLAQHRTDAEIALILKPDAFTPPPKVESAVVVLRPKAAQVAVDMGALSRITAAAFGQRRKMLRASLKQLTPMPELLLASAGVAPEARAETLTIDQFVALARAWRPGPHTSDNPST